MGDYASFSESILRPTHDRISQLRLLKLRVHALGCIVSLRRVEDGSLLPQYIIGPQERSWLTKSFDLRPRYRSVSYDYATLICLECFYKERIDMKLQENGKYLDYAHQRNTSPSPFPQSQLAKGRPKFRLFSTERF